MKKLFSDKKKEGCRGSDDSHIPSTRKSGHCHKKDNDCKKCKKPPAFFRTREPNSEWKSEFEIKCKHVRIRKECDGAKKISSSSMNKPARIRLHCFRKGCPQKWRNDFTPYVHCASDAKNKLQ